MGCKSSVGCSDAVGGRVVSVDASTADVEIGHSTNDQLGIVQVDAFAHSIT